MLSRSNDNISFSKIQCQITDMKGKSKNIFFKDGEKIDIDRYEDKFVIKNYDKKRFINAKTLSIDLIDHDSYVNYADYVGTKNTLSVKSVQQYGSLIVFTPLNNSSSSVQIDEIGKNGSVTFENAKGSIKKLLREALLNVRDASSVSVEVNHGIIDVKLAEDVSKNRLNLGLNQGLVKVDEETPKHKNQYSMVRIKDNQGKVTCPIESHDIIIKKGYPVIPIF